ncbi:MAG: hypothetical protein N3B21_15430 [Clostridia bacterium]|nr:hypothetical protein [Clostridia bacterium]
MKKTHLALLVIAGIMALCSVYSLAAINQIYRINFEWYSHYQHKFTGEYREALRDKWQLPDYPEKMKFEIFGDKSEFVFNNDTSILSTLGITNVDFNRFILFYADMGQVNSPEYRIKFFDIAQRGSVVEIKVGVNSPEDKSEKTPLEQSHTRYHPIDVIRIDRKAFPVNGELLFIFKNQDGKELFQKHYKI